MKKVLLTLAIALTFGGMTTGCAAKKRVQKLEAELLRCKETKQELRQKLKSQKEEAPAGDETREAVARAEQPDD